MSGEQPWWESPWVARARTVSSWRGNGSPTDHATLDGITTLCGMKEIGGSDRTVPFDTSSAWSCKRCGRAIDRLPVGYCNSLAHATPHRPGKLCRWWQPVPSAPRKPKRGMEEK